MIELVALFRQGLGGIQMLSTGCAGEAVSVQNAAAGEAQSLFFFFFFFFKRKMNKRRDSSNKNHIPPPQFFRMQNTRYLVRQEPASH